MQVAEVSLNLNHLSVYRWLYEIFYDAFNNESLKQAFEIANESVLQWFRVIRNPTDMLKPQTFEKLKYIVEDNKLRRSLANWRGPKNDSPPNSIKSVANVSTESCQSSKSLSEDDHNSRGQRDQAIHSSLGLKQVNLPQLMSTPARQRSQSDCQKNVVRSHGCATINHSLEDNRQPPCTDGLNITPSFRKARVFFTDLQVDVMKSVYKHRLHIRPDECERLAQLLELQPQQVGSSHFILIPKYPVVL